MDAIRNFIDMGGYGAYIWPSYGVTAVFLVVMLVTSLRLLKSNEATMKTLEASTKEKTGEKKA